MHNDDVEQRRVDEIIKGAIQAWIDTNILAVDPDLDSPECPPKLEEIKYHRSAANALWAVARFTGVDMPLMLFHGISRYQIVSSVQDIQVETMTWEKRLLPTMQSMAANDDAYFADIDAEMAEMETTTSDYYRNLDS